jgi:hypothetical protein
LGKVRQPRAIGLDDEEDGPPVPGTDRGRHRDGDESATGAHQGRRTVQYLAADRVEDHVDLTGVLQPVGLQVEEDIHTETECPVPAAGPAGADHPGSDLARELHRDRADTTCRAVDQHRLPRREPAVVEQALPRGQPRDRQCGGLCVVDVRRERSEVAGLHRGVLGQRAVAGPVGEAEHPLADGETGRSVAEFGDDARQFVSGHTRGPVAARTVLPRPRPVELPGREPRGMHAHHDVVLGGVRIRQLRQGEPTDAG